MYHISAVNDCELICVEGILQQEERGGAASIGAWRQQPHDEQSFGHGKQSWTSFMFLDASKSALSFVSGGHDEEQHDFHDSKCSHDGIRVLLLRRLCSRQVGLLERVSVERL
jgi:hypothetical protein